MYKRQALEGALGEAESVKPIWKPQTNIAVDEERAQSLMKLVATLEDDDDVQSVYANFISDCARSSSTAILVCGFQIGFTDSASPSAPSSACLLYTSRCV